MRKYVPTQRQSDSTGLVSAVTGMFLTPRPEMEWEQPQQKKDPSEIV